nr:solute carrier family 22 member 15-like [Penaeus vannamei]
MSVTESVQRITPRLRTITLSLYTNYLLVGAVYFGLSLSGGDLSSDPFLYMVLTGVVELPAYTLVIPLVARYGRRAPVVAFFFMGAVALLALPFVPTVSEVVWGGGSGESMTLALMGKMSIASAFQILDFYSSELFPTEVRTRGMSTALVMSRVGSTCSPFITDYLVIFDSDRLVSGVGACDLAVTKCSDTKYYAIDTFIMTIDADSAQQIQNIMTGKRQYIKID